MTSCQLNPLHRKIGFSDKIEYATLDELDPSMPGHSLLNLYGILVFVIYTIISTILLGNLLIAIITNRYRSPDLFLSTVGIIL